MESAAQERRKYDRRTGVALLSLMAATNVVPWMELLLGETATAELLSPSEIRVAIGTCLLALLLILAVWFFGRRGALPESPKIGRPRRAGLLFSCCAAAGNILLAAGIRLMGSRVVSGGAVLPVFATAWYFVVLPLEAAAAFSLGRAGRMPGRRRAEGEVPSIIGPE